MHHVEQDVRLEGPSPDDTGDPDASELPVEEAHGPGRRRAMISWVVSGALHATMLMLLGTIYFLAQESEQEIPPMRVQNIPPPPERKAEKPKMERELLDPKVQLDIEMKSDNPSPITPLDLPEDNSVSEEQNDSAVAKGREEAVSSTETGGQGAFMAIGAGGGSAGMFGSRSGGGRKRAVGRGGGSKGSESAVEASLRWFRIHQSPNGQWDAVNYFKNCTDDPKCEPGQRDGNGSGAVDIGVTGLALLCYLGAGYDHITPNKYRETVRKGIAWLTSVQKPDGLFGERNYENAIATMALAEAYAMTNSPQLRESVQKGVDIILKNQNPGDAAGASPATASSLATGLGWDYGRGTSRNDASVTAWNVMALKSAYAAGLPVKGGMDGAKRWLELAWKANNDGQAGRPDWQKLDPYTDSTLFSYCWPSGATTYEVKGFSGQHHSSMALVCAVFLGHRSGDPMLETLANCSMKTQTPTAYPTNTYYMYYNTLGMFQLGGERWKAWNSVVRDMLINAQRKGDGCFDGSWDWQKCGFHGQDVGRTLNTAFCTLSLEVYYRYAQVNAAKGH